MAGCMFLYVCEAIKDTHSNTNTRGDTKERNKERAKSHRIHHQRKHYSQTLRFRLSQPFARQKLLMSQGEKVKIRQPSPAPSLHI